MDSWINFFFILTFISLISIGIWTQWIGLGITSENPIESNLTSYPPVNTFEDWITFHSRFDIFLADNFPVRTDFVRRIYWARYKILKQKVFPQTLVGKDGWIYYTSEQNIADYQKTNLLNTQQIEEIQKKIDHWGIFFEERGIPFVILVAPNKETIYPEYIPNIAQPLGTTSRLDQILTQIKFPANIQVVDPREALLQAKQKEIIYFKTDTHWNINGGCIAYSMLMSSIQNQLSYLKPFKCEDVQRSKIIVSGDLSNMLGMIGVLTEENFIGSINNSQTQITQKNGRFWIVSESSLPNRFHIMVYRDSFFTELIPLLSENFSRVDYFWNFQINYDLINRERPDLVVFEFTERYAQEALLNHPFEESK